MITVSSVANASQGELLCIVYELLLKRFHQITASEGKARKKHIEEAIYIIKTLVEALNFDIEMSHDLFRLYVYVQGLLLAYEVKNDKVEEAYAIIYKLYKGFKEAAIQEKNAGPSMKNVQEVYAGITYNKGQLSEIVLEEVNRGFKA